MKRLIAFLLIPVAFIFLILKKMWEVTEPLAIWIGDGMIEILEMNYDFWKKIFKWR